MSINPIKLIGPWKEGYSLDQHIISSEYIGDDIYEHPQFSSTRSKIGELVYQLKYRNNISVIDDIINLAKPFIIDKWNIQKLADVIIPIPPTNTNRKFQPVFELCTALGKHLEIPVDLGVLSNYSKTQVKDLQSADKIKVLTNSIRLNKHFRCKINILLVDDLYDSGSTIKVSTRLLQSDLNVVNVYILTMTKTRGS